MIIYGLLRRREVVKAKKVIRSILGEEIKEMGLANLLK